MAVSICSTACAEQREEKAPMGGGVAKASVSAPDVIAAAEFVVKAEEVLSKKAVPARSR